MKVVSLTMMEMVLGIVWGGIESDDKWESREDESKKGGEKGV